MRKTIMGTTVTAVAVGVLLVGADPASASTRSGHHEQRVSVVGSTGATRFSTTYLHAGLVRFDISTTNPNGTGVTLFSLHRGVAMKQFSADLAEEFSNDSATEAKGTRDLVRDVTVYGLADVNPGTPASATIRLGAGTYYSIDSNSGQLPTAATTTKITVCGDGRGDDGWWSDGRRLASVSMTSSDRFVVRGHLPAHGSVLVKNVSDTLHFMILQPVAAGTTDGEVQAYFDSGSQDQPPFALDGPSASTDVLSPGRDLVLGYNLPKGTYVLLCFVADDETGMPHALMGMHKVIKIG